MSQHVPQRAPGHIRSEDVEEMPFVSQRDYRPTPYLQTDWEIVGEQVKERGFMPLEVNILHTEGGAADPMFEVFDKGFSPRHELLLHGVGARKSHEAEEEEELSAHAAEIARLNAEWQAKLEAAQAASHEEGRKGAEARIMDRYEVLAQQLKAVTDSIYQQWSGLAGRLERQALDLSMNISRRILSTTVEAKPEYILEVIREALKQLGAAKPVRIRVSLDDFEFLNVIGLPLELSEQELESPTSLTSRLNLAA